MRRLLRLVPGLAALLVVMMPGPVTAALPPAQRYYVTLYGFVDNSPPGTVISNPQIHSHAAAREPSAIP
jgi:hypothetical protein